VSTNPRMRVRASLEHRAATKLATAVRAEADPLAAAAGYARGLLAAALDQFDAKAEGDGVTEADVAAFHDQVVGAFDALNEALAPEPQAPGQGGPDYPTAWKR